MVSLKVIISGRVQGVWYRGWTVETARSLGLTGWVRNRRDGTVQACFAGDESAVQEMMELCWKGPPAAKVTSVEQKPTEVPSSESFVQLPTA
ncbi:MAG: acylphosphatase [Rhodospirillaceae bacterium]|nr:acylphosphatase [Rhodospirillaceae bacterium]